ncbi:Canalicular multispecific organic anion transporter 1 [Homalodisca vitripennis]|nr:Canalicular multispecific organic anion transporter 1 [Homalodisca vitripennis]
MEGRMRHEVERVHLSTDANSPMLFLILASLLLRGGTSCSTKASCYVINVWAPSRIDFCGNIVSPLLVISFVSSDESLWKGCMYATLMLITSTVQAFLLSRHYLIMNFVGNRITTALISAIYRKLLSTVAVQRVVCLFPTNDLMRFWIWIAEWGLALSCLEDSMEDSLKLSNAARKQSTLGEVINLMAVDASAFQKLMVSLTLIWSAPFQIIVALYFLWQFLGPAVLSGLGFMILMIPVNVWLVRQNKRLRTMQMKYKDERIKIMSEVLSGIKGGLAAVDNVIRG